MPITRIKLSGTLDGDSILGAPNGPQAGVLFGGSNVGVLRRDSDESIIEVSQDEAATFPGARSGDKLVHGQPSSIKRNPANNNLVSIAGQGTVHVRSDTFTFSTGAWASDLDIFDPLNTSDSPDVLCHTYTPAGVFHLVFYDNIGINPIYHITGATETEIVAHGGVYGSWGSARPGILADADGNIHVFFKATAPSDRSSNDTIYHIMYNGSSWGTPTAVKADVADHHVLSGEFLPVMDTGGNIYLAIFANDATSAVRPYLCIWNGSSWSNEVIDADFIERNSEDIITAVDNLGVVYVMCIGETVEQTNSGVSQPHVYKRTSANTYELTSLDQENFDITGDVRAITNVDGDVGNLPAMGAAFLFRGDWDINNTAEDFVVNAELVISNLELTRPPPVEFVESVELERPSGVEPVAIETEVGRLIEKPKELLGLARDDHEREVYEIVDDAIGKFYEYLRTFPQQVCSALTAMAEAMPGDKRHRFEVRGPGDANLEIVVAHGLGYVPTNIETVEPGEYGQVALSRDRLGDVENFYIKTDVPQGARVVVRVW